MTTEIEKKMLDVTKVKPRSFKNRQDFLLAVLVAFKGLPNEVYEDETLVSDEMVEWYEAGATARNLGKVIPDFDGTGAEAEVAEEADDLDPTEDNIEPEGETEAVAPPKKGKKAKAAPAPKPQAEPKAKSKRKAPPTPTATGSKNRYGIYEGTILDDVCQMLEKGCSMADVKAKHGETKYNLLHRLEKEGHKLDKGDGKFKLTHKDDVKAKGKKK